MTQNLTLLLPPSNSMFEFENSGAKIDISGTVVVKFKGRRLSVDMDRLLQAAGKEETAEFNLNMSLDSAPKFALEGDDNAMINFAKATYGKAFVILGMVFASAFALW